MGARRRNWLVTEPQRTQSGVACGLPHADNRSAGILSVELELDPPGDNALEWGMAVSTKEYPVIQGIRVDVDALRALAHRCDPMLCRHMQYCCKSYDVLLDREEERRVVGMMGEAAKHAPTLIENGSFVDPIEDMFEDECLATDEHGECVFAYQTAQGALRCSLHSAALDLGLPPAEVKPKACTLWPLFLDENPPALLTVQDDALEFPCNTLRADMDGRARPALRLHEGVREIIEAIFGADFLAEVEAALR